MQRGRDHAKENFNRNIQKPYIDAERAILVTEAYKSNHNQPPIMKRALGLKNILEK